VGEVLCAQIQAVCVPAAEPTPFVPVLGFKVASADQATPLYSKLFPVGGEPAG